MIPQRCSRECCKNSKPLLRSHDDLSSNNKIRKITPAGVVTTFAGSGSATTVDGTGTGASFNVPVGIAIDSSDNLYVSESTGNRIRKITPAAVVTTFAGSGTASSVDGTGTAATFNSPFGIAIDSSNNLYVSESTGNRIRQITPAGVVTTFAGSGTAGSTDATGTAATFAAPQGLALDRFGNLFVADRTFNKIRKVTPAGVVTTLAGSGTAGTADGTGTAASFNTPQNMIADSTGTLYVADRSNNKIRMITPAGVVTTWAGSGTAGSAVGPTTGNVFNGANGLASDSNGTVYVAEYSGHRIDTISPTGSGKLAVAWTAPASNGGSAITDYTIQYRTSPAGTWTTFNDGVSTATSTTITGLTDGTAYDVQILAVNTAGAGAASTAATATPGVAPGAPTSLTLTGASGQIAASWTAPSSTGGATISDYVVEYRTSPSGTWTVFPDGTSTTASATITGLTDGTAYDVRISTVNTFGVGTASATATLTAGFPSGLVLRLDANTVASMSQDSAGTTAVSATGQSVCRWADISGVGNHATQTTTSMCATYGTDATGGFLNFAANGYYRPTVNLSPDASIFVVAQSNTTTWNQTGWLASSRGPNGFIIHPWSGNNSLSMYIMNSSANYVGLSSFNVASITNPVLYELTMAGSGTVTGIYGTNGTTGAYSVAATRTAGSVTVSLGSDDDAYSAGRRGDGKYREVMIFNRALSTSERTTVENYLRTKWGTG